MAADRRRGFADIDDALFDTTQIPMTSRDIRSVGEMLFDVDHLARQLLMDVAGDDAGTLLRGWPTMVAAAADLWASLPGQDRRRRDDPRSAHHPPGLGRRPRHRGQPVRPQGLAAGKARPTPHRPDDQDPPSRRDLVRRYGAEIPLEQHRGSPRPRGSPDPDHARPVPHRPRRRRLPAPARPRPRTRTRRGAGRRIELAQHHSPYAVPPPPGWIAACPSARAPPAGYLDGRFTQALPARPCRPVEDPRPDLAQALAGWDIQAHRALASRRIGRPTWCSSPAPKDSSPAPAMVLVDAAATRRHPRALGPAGHRRSPKPAAPGATSPAAGATSLPQVPASSPDLMRAAAEVRAAYREITHDTTTLASLEVIATRPGLARGHPRDPPRDRVRLRARLRRRREGRHPRPHRARPGPLPPCPQRRRGRPGHPTGRWRRRLGLARRHPRPTPRPSAAAGTGRLAYGEYGNRVRGIHRGSICHARASQPRRPSPCLALAFSAGCGERAGGPALRRPAPSPDHGGSAGNPRGLH